MTATNAYGSQIAYSSSSAQIVASAPLNTVAPIASGAAQDSQVISATSGSWSGSPTITYSYQWQTASASAGPYSNIAGATASSYTVQSSDIGNYLRANVSATNSAGSASAPSNALGAVSGIAPTNTSSPVLAGSFTDGQSVSGSNGTWTGSPVITYTYQWQSASAAAGPYANIVGATAASYTIPSAQVGNYLRLCVTAANTYGSSAAQCSSPSGAVSAAAPVNSVAPVASGSAQDGASALGLVPRRSPTLISGKMLAPRRDPTRISLELPRRPTLFLPPRSAITCELLLLPLTELALRALPLIH